MSLDLWTDGNRSRNAGKHAFWAVQTALIHPVKSTELNVHHVPVLFQCSGVHGKHAKCDVPRILADVILIQNLVSSGFKQSSACILLWYLM